MSRQQRITAILTEAFRPKSLEVIDESGKHAGHQPGFQGQGETHLKIRIVAQAFSNMGRVERHRAVNDLLKGEFDAGLHALTIEANAP